MLATIAGVISISFSAEGVPAVKIYKTLVALANEGGDIFTADTIKHEGKMWLVPTWLENPTEGYKIPERIVCLDTLQHQRTPEAQEDFCINVPIPRTVLYGPAPSLPAHGYVVKFRPDVRIPIPRGIH
jgi:hypothetical protein